MQKPSLPILILWVGTFLALCSPGLAFQILLPPSFEKSEADLPPVSHPLIAQNRSIQPVPPLPDAIPDAIVPMATGIVGLSPAVTDNIGIGHLRPKDLPVTLEASDPGDTYSNAGWLQAAALPIYIEPEGNHWGWIVNGWLIPNGQSPIAIGRDAAFSMLQTYDRLFSFPVTEIREDGWFQLQYTPAGTAWAHVDHLNLGTVNLAIELWEDRFLDTNRLYFRRPGLSKPLYSSPVDNDDVLGLISSGSLIEPVAIDGDWMQVRVTQPVNGCTVLPGARTQEGWIRWRDTNSRSMVWYAPEGC